MGLIGRVLGAGPAEVGAAVGNVRNNGPDLVRPVGPDVQLSLETPVDAPQA